MLKWLRHPVRRLNALMKQRAYDLGWDEALDAVKVMLRTQKGDSAS